MMRLAEVWERLDEIKGMSVDEVISWLEVNDEHYDDDFDYSETDECGWIGGYYSDYAPCIEFEDGVVARWYREGAWD